MLRGGASRIMTEAARIHPQHRVRRRLLELLETHDNSIAEPVIRLADAVGEVTNSGGRKKAAAK